MNNNVFALPLNRVPGSIEWSDKIRANCKHAVQNIEQTSFELGGWLEQIFNQKDTEGAPVWKGWGYETFEAYVERELNTSARSGERMRKIWRTITDLSEGEGALDFETRERLLELGSSRLNHLVRVLTKENALEWINWCTRGDVSVRDLEQKVIQQIERETFRQRQLLLQSQGQNVVPLEGAQQPQEGALLPPGVSFDGDFDKSLLEGGLDESGQPLPSLGDRLIGGFPEGTAANDRPTTLSAPASGDALPKEKLITRKIQMDEGTLGVMNQAIKTIQKATGFRGDGYALGLICLSYLGTVDYDRKGVSPAQAMAMVLQQMERSMGLRLVAIDPKNSTLVYGQTSLQLLASKLNQIETALEAFAPAADPSLRTPEDSRAIEAFAPTMPEGEAL